jgi:hypothetical protein
MLLMGGSTMTRVGGAGRVQGVVQEMQGLERVCREVVLASSELWTAGSRSFPWAALASSTVTWRLSSRAGEAGGFRQAAEGLQEVVVVCW